MPIALLRILAGHTYLAIDSKAGQDYMSHIAERRSIIVEGKKCRKQDFFTKLAAVLAIASSLGSARVEKTCN